MTLIHCENVVQRLILTFLFFTRLLGLTVCRCLHALCLCLVAVCQLFLYEYMDMDEYGRPRKLTLHKEGQVPHSFISPGSCRGQGVQKASAQRVQHCRYSVTAWSAGNNVRKGL